MTRYVCVWFLPAIILGLIGSSIWLFFVVFSCFLVFFVISCYLVSRGVVLCDVNS
jgi:hypothetical protein